MAKEILMFIPKERWSPVIHTHKTCVYTMEGKTTAHMPNVAHGI
jgi:hypothetical protein